MAMANFSKEGRTQFAGTQGGLMQNPCVQHSVVQGFVWVNVILDVLMDSPEKGAWEISRGCRTYMLFSEFFLCHKYQNLLK